MPTEESVTPTNAIIIPSLTSVPTETKTPIPTAIFISPTPTLYLSPLPTLSIQQEGIKFYQFYNFINGCRLPCLWGITPGVTTWAELKQFINQFNSWNQINKEKVSVTKSYQRYTWSIPNPLPYVDFSSSVSFDIENNIVKAITLDEILAYHLFPLDRLLNEYGQPDKILLDAHTYYDIKNNPTNSVDIHLLYEHEYILSAYHFSEYGAANGKDIRVCLDDSQLTPMILWSASKELEINFTGMKPLSNFSELDNKTFYNRFEYKGNKCFEMSKDAWK